MQIQIIIEFDQRISKSYLLLENISITKYNRTRDVIGCFWRPRLSTNQYNDDDNTPEIPTQNTSCSLWGSNNVKIKTSVFPLNCYWTSLHLYKRVAAAAVCCV